MMLPVTHVLAFGAWLVAQSKATPSALTISIFLKPPGVIPPGGSTTICCSCQCDSGRFVLYKKGHQLRSLEPRGGRAEFSISNATQEDSGAYSCHYLDGDTVLARSETLEVTVHEFRLPRPVLSILPGRDVAAGASVTFRCAIAHSSATCFLYREGQVEAQQTSNEDREVSFPRVTKGDGGCYSCQCFTWNASFQWSAVSEAQDLVVRDYTRSNAVRLALGAGVLLLLGLIVAEALGSRRRRPGPR
ncbi:osteoclast-associated immunoglobulin-like receptor isoform X2 [Opisthocomus hoazin]|uniref:osteoclast-associated immunoglobulin-like receptor isoform X2 n=1 Tax=Opisthocomus hoazin TaxID=30419 RepID=UPI003F52D12E